MRKTPNIVYILSDDWGYGDVGCLNPESKIPTPFTDALAQRGMMFTDAHSNSAVCTPTRYGVLTGRYCWRGVLKQGVLGGFDDLIIEPDRMTVASLLGQAGYRTACIGKWHLGLGWARWGGATQPPPNRANDPTVDYSRLLHRGPHTCGFDYSFILPSSLDIIPYCYIENGWVVEQPTALCNDSPRPAFWRGGPIAPGLEHETCLLEFTMRAEQFIADHAVMKPQHPFFLYLALPSPHTPHVPRKPFVGKSQVGAYGDYVVEHDWSIGRILSTLDRQGLTDDTLVIVTSDNGAHIRGETFDFEREFGHRSNYIYRGQKADVWDGGHRVPFFAVWPGHIPAGSTCHQQVCLTDFLATAAELTGCVLPEDAGEDSISMLPLMMGQVDRPTRHATVHHSYFGRFAIRRGEWKLIEGPGSGGGSLPDDEVPASEPRMQLYHMRDDPEEQHNLINDRPKIAQELLDLLNRCRDARNSRCLQAASKTDYIDSNP